MPSDLVVGLNPSGARLGGGNPPAANHKEGNRAGNSDGDPSATRLTMVENSEKFRPSWCLKDTSSHLRGNTG
jgi:hypothetical protein